jgi:Domain of unknown function (DUF3806)
MLFWKKKSIDESLQPRDLPGEVGRVSLPAWLTVEMENDSTLIASPPENDAIALRISSLSFTKKDDPGGIAAETHARRQAADRGVPCETFAGKPVFTYDEPSTGADGNPLTIRFWMVGAKTTLVVISASISSSKQKDATVRRLLDAMRPILESITITTTHLVASHDGQEANLTTKAVDNPPPQQIVPFGPAENIWLEKSRDAAGHLCIKYGSGGDLTPKELDVVFGRWMADCDQKESPQAVAEALAAAFGEHLVDREGFGWVVVTDSYGTEYAIRKGETVAFPQSSVMKRIERNETEFFQSLEVGILHTLKCPPG